MGWNQGYAIYENVVINIYDAGVLTKEFLNEFMQFFVNSDMDHGGSMGLRSRDGLTADEIVCKLMEPERFAAIPRIPDEMPQRVKWADGKYVIEIMGIKSYHDTWQEAIRDEQNCLVDDLWREITRREWELW